MNRFTVGFSKPKKWKPLAQLIMLVGGTPYSHTFNTWKCVAIQRRKVFEAVGSGLRIISNVTFKASARIVELYHFDNVSDEELVELEQLAHDMVGTEYGYKALIGLGVAKLFNYINDIMGIHGTQSNFLRDGSKSNVCIEASARQMCKLLKIELPKDIESYDLKDYNQLVKKYGKAESSKIISKINGDLVI